MVDAVYPGSFDPLHNGHLDVVTRAAKLFDSLLVAIYETPPKNVLFSTEERVELFSESVAQLDNVEVAPFKGLVTQLARDVGAGYVVRGLRAGYDFESEFEMALMWRHLDPGIDVVCMMSALEYQFLYSSRIKEVARLGADIQGLVPEQVAERLNAKLNGS
jgi:pantetheine-phosphate adenylyltransferase